MPAAAACSMARLDGAPTAREDRNAGGGRLLDQLVAGAPAHHQHAVARREQVVRAAASPTSLSTALCGRRPRAPRAARRRARTGRPRAARPCGRTSPAPGAAPPEFVDHGGRDARARDRARARPRGGQRLEIGAAADAARAGDDERRDLAAAAAAAASAGPARRRRCRRRSPPRTADRRGPQHALGVEKPPPARVLAGRAHRGGERALGHRRRATRICNARSIATSSRTARGAPCRAPTSSASHGFDALVVDFGPRKYTAIFHHGNS